VRRPRGFPHSHYSRRRPPPPANTPPQYFCRSLDTWLDGKCEPLIDPDHWKLKFAAHDKTIDVSDGKSIFDACDEADDSQGDGAGFDDLPDDGTRYFYVNKSNGWKMVENAMVAKGFTRLPFEYVQRECSEREGRAGGGGCAKDTKRKRRTIGSGERKEAANAAHDRKRRTKGTLRDERSNRGSSRPS
jgi:hypothetical protein